MEKSEEPAVKPHPGIRVSFLPGQKVSETLHFLTRSHEEVMTFAEIGDSDSDGSEIELLPQRSTPAQAEEPIYASGIAERAKDRGRAAKNATRAPVDVLDFISDEENPILVKPKKKKTTTTTTKEKASNTIVIDEDEDDLSMSFGEPGPVVAQQPAIGLPQASDSAKKKRARGKNALDIYNAPRLESPEPSSRKRKDKTHKTSTRNISDGDRQGNNDSSSVPSNHIDATPGLPPPIPASKSQSEPLAKLERSAKRMSNGDIKDSQSSGASIRHKDTQSSPLDLPRNTALVSFTSNPVAENGARNHTDDLDELAGPESDLKNTVVATDFRRSKDDLVKTKTKALSNVSTEESDKESDRHADPVRRGLVDREDDHRSNGVPNTYKSGDSSQAPVKKRARRRILGSDESEAHVSENEAEEYYKGSNTKSRSETTNEADKLGVESSKILKLKLKRKKVESVEPGTDEEESKLPSVSIESQAAGRDDTKEEMKSELATPTVTVKTEESKIVNYAASAGKNPAMKFNSGPRHRVGLSRRQRVEPLHANIVRKS